MNSWIKFAAAAMGGLLARVDRHAPLVGGGETVESAVDSFPEIAALIADALVAERCTRTASDAWDEFAAAATTGMVSRIAGHIPGWGGGETLQSYVPTIAKLAARVADVMVARISK